MSPGVETIQGVETIPREEPIQVHGSAVVLGEKGVLIRGASGAGKSILALALVEAGRQRGDFARLIGDDRICVRIAGGRALVSPHKALHGLAEWRGIGLIELDFEGCAVLGLIVDLESAQQHADCPRMPEPEELRADFLGLPNVPLLRLTAQETAMSVAAIMAFLHKVSPK